MNRKAIPIDIQRRLWANSGGVCGNPQCGKSLFDEGKSISEVAHIEPYSETQNNSCQNLIILCPNCHTQVDKGGDIQKLKSWKEEQENKIRMQTSKKFQTFGDLKKEVQPILQDNRLIYEHYYLGQETSDLWQQFEPKLLVNNAKIKRLFASNLDLFQGTKDYDGNNYALAEEFILHVKEFEETRTGDKIRKVLYPKEINSIFDIDVIEEEDVVANVSALQNLIKTLKEEKLFKELNLLSDPPYLECFAGGNFEKLYLNDKPKVRQVYWDTGVYKNSSSDLNLTNVIFLLKWLDGNDFHPHIPDESNLSVITIMGGERALKLVHEYCLSEANIYALSPKKESIIVNLYRWNGKGSVSTSARKLAEAMGAKVLSTSEFFPFCHNVLK